jgi:hypothetical protein
VNTPAIAHGYTANLDGLGQRGTGFGGKSLVVYGKFETEFLQTFAKGGDVLEACDLNVVGTHITAWTKKYPEKTSGANGCEMPVSFIRWFAKDVKGGDRTKPLAQASIPPYAGKTE